ncbi:MAG: hypothetical protein L0338_12200, partial [Acidobacteria bacterium]|nr:hypothetical protein [Acidobacteriota bacterium]
RTLRLESVRSASETLAWLRLYTDRAHNNRKAVRKDRRKCPVSRVPRKRECNSFSGRLDSRFRGNDESDWHSAKTTVDGG